MVAHGDKPNVAPPRRAVDRHCRVLGSLDPVEHPFLINRDPAPPRYLDSRQDSCLVEPIVVLRLIDIGLDLVNETGRPEADPAEP